MAALIIGASGSGKSALALQMIALGAGLVADDRTILRRRDGAVIASCPSAIRGQIEARGVGILAANPVSTARLCLVVDMGAEETERLPDPLEMQVLGITLPLIRKSGAGHFPAAVLLYLQGGRIA